MIDFIKKNILILLFTFAGGLGGFLYWKFIGCTSGTCPIKSVWYMSTLWGLLMGYLIGSLVRDSVKALAKRKEAGNGNKPQQ